MPVGGGRSGPGVKILEMAGLTCRSRDGRNGGKKIIFMQLEGSGTGH